MSSTALNLERIRDALVQHNGNCRFRVLAICMAPFEVERLGFDNFNGIPIEPDPKMPTGRLRIVCEGSHSGARPSAEVEEEIEAPAPAERELVPAGPSRDFPHDAGGRSRPSLDLLTRVH